jgi:hypothetical protein
VPEDAGLFRGGANQRREEWECEVGALRGEHGGVSWGLNNWRLNYPQYDAAGRGAGVKIL